MDTKNESMELDDFIMEEDHSAKDVRHHFAIIAPSFVDNLEEFVKCCGGKASMQKYFKLPRERLRFKFRPKDLNTSPLYSNRRNATDLAVKVKRKRKPDGSYDYSVETIGVIDVLFDFENLLCDFQLLPAKKDICDDILKWDFVMKCDHNFTLADDTQNTIMKQHNYSRFSTPRFLYRELLNEDIHKSDFMSEQRKSRSYLGMFIKWDEEPPKEMPENIRQKIPMQPHNVELSKRIESLFNKRPVYYRPTLMNLLKSKTWNIKQTLPYHAYCYSTGPFRYCWVKYGYDVRLEKGSKIYQSIDCRNKNVNHEGIKNRLAIFKDHSVIYKSEFVGSSYVDETVQFDSSMHESVDQPQASASSTTYTEHIFEPGKLSMFKHNIYQLCDIHIDEVQAIIHENDGQEVECKEKDGWLKEGSIDRIRKLMISAMNDMLKTDDVKRINLEDSDVIVNFNEGDDQIEQEMMEIFDNLE